MLGERVQMGQYIYTVFETQWMTQIGEGSAARIPRHRFLLVRLSMTNAGSVDALASPLSLVDDKGVTYQELSNGDGVPSWAGTIRQMKPAESVQGNIVFDVSPAHYKLRVTDESEQKIGLVDLPLSFGSESPNLPIPEAGVDKKGGDSKGMIQSPGSR